MYDVWDNDVGGIYYILNFDGLFDRWDCYWWFVIEVIGVMVVFFKLDLSVDYLDWY